MPELTLPLAHHIAVDCNLDKHQTICDFGCAKGYLVYALRLLGYDAYGVDISEYAISSPGKQDIDDALVRSSEFKRISKPKDKDPFGFGTERR